MKAKQPKKSLSSSKPRSQKSGGNEWLENKDGIGQSFRADVGITLNGINVSDWADQVGGLAFTEITNKPSTTSKRKSPTSRRREFIKRLVEAIYYRPYGGEFFNHVFPNGEKVGIVG